MKKVKTNQQGFGSVEIVVTCLVVAVIGATGLVVFRHSSKSAVKTSTSPTTSQTTAKPDNTTTQPAQPAQQYLVIKEWGVQLTLDSTTSSLYYYIKPELPDVAYLSLKTVSDIAPNCAADQISLAAIGRLTEAEQQASLSKPITALNHPGTLHVGSYWYNFDLQHQASCYDNTAQEDAVNRAQPTYNLETVFKTIAPAASTTN